MTDNPNKPQSKFVQVSRNERDIAELQAIWGAFLVSFTCAIFARHFFHEPRQAAGILGEGFWCPGLGLGCLAFADL